MKDHYKEMMEAGVMPDNLEKTDIEKLVGEFNQWADERIFDCSLMVKEPFLTDDVEIKASVQARVDELNWAKKNLSRLAKEIKG